jgi:predicted nuclease of predicted toxin-antitoxin system
VRILSDEDVENPIIARLRSDGHTVEAFAEQTPGLKDIPILARAVAEGILLLTADLDFGAYIFRDGQAGPHEGVVLYRLGEDIETDRKAAIISDAFAQHAGSFAGHFTVIEEQSVRFRPLPNAPTATSSEASPG